ncbi:hypothetical protein ACMT1E_10805 [Sphingomonas flavalba]|uniref:NAD(P)H-dependent amine dehydrogenase family protein n=1 Tax=Sphingomonas flavalba TaxID=2559804 RepID=UPI0039E1D2CB
MKHRVVQWGTGMVGARALKQALLHPAIEVVGVRVYNPAKVGSDAGALAGLGQCGVTATDDVDAILKLRPDCVVHAPLSLDLEETIGEIETLLAAGINVVSSAVNVAIHPGSMDPGLRSRLVAACKAGASTLRAAGLSPGFANELLPVVMSGLCGAIRRVTVSEFANLAHYESEAVSALLGWGREASYVLPDAFRARIDQAFLAPMRMIGSCLGTEITDIATSVSPAIATKPFDIRTGQVAAGTIAGWRLMYVGSIDGEARVSIDSSWHLHEEFGIGEDWPKGEGWDISIDADPEIRLHWEVGLDDPTQSMSSHRMRASAAHLVNAVPAVCAAPSGIMTLADLGNATGRWA